MKAEHHRTRSHQDGTEQTMDERESERLTSEAVIFTVVEGLRRPHVCQNISRLGCMIETGDLRVSTGTDVEVEFVAGVSVPGRVIWSRQGHLGIAFRDELNLATVRYLALIDRPDMDDHALRDRFGRLLPEILARAS